MLALPSVLNHAQAAPSKVWVDNARAHQWQIDCGALQDFDSSALALLLDLRRSAMQNHQTLTICNAPAKLTQLATLYGVAELLA